MQVRVGCEFRYEATWPTPTVIQVQPRPDGDHHLLHETWETTPNIESRLYHDSFGNLCRRLVAPSGEQVWRYDAIAEVSDEPDLIRPRTLYSIRLKTCQMIHWCIRCQAASASPTCFPIKHGRFLVAPNPVGRVCKQSAIGCILISASNMVQVRRPQLPPTFVPMVWASVVTLPILPCPSVVR